MPPIVNILRNRHSSSEDTSSLTIYYRFIVSDQISSLCHSFHRESSIKSFWTQALLFFNCLFIFSSSRLTSFGKHWHFQIVVPVSDYQQRFLSKIYQSWIFTQIILLIRWRSSEMVTDQIVDSRSVISFTSVKVFLTFKYFILRNRVLTLWLWYITKSTHASNSYKSSIAVIPTTHIRFDCASETFQKSDNNSATSLPNKFNDWPIIPNFTLSLLRSHVKMTDGENQQPNVIQK